MYHCPVKYFISLAICFSDKPLYVENGKELLSMKGHTLEVSRLTISAVGFMLVSASADKTIREWDLRNGRLRTTFTAEGSNECCAVDPDCKSVVCGDISGDVYFLIIEP